MWWEELYFARNKQGGLGFRELHMFNLATLARQGWRLLVNLESLYAQVLRAKYFSDGDLLKAKEKSGISYSWRSVLRGIQAPKNGLIDVSEMAHKLTFGQIIRSQIT